MLYKGGLNEMMRDDRNWFVTGICKKNLTDCLQKKCLCRKQEDGKNQYYIIKWAKSVMQVNVG